MAVADIQRQIASRAKARTEPIIPAAGSHRPGVVNVRLIGPADVVDAAIASLGDFYGELWQPSTRKPSRTSSDVVLYGTLIVPVPARAEHHRADGPHT